MPRFNGEPAVLSTLPPLSWLSEAQIARALPSIQSHTYAPRTCILNAGDPADGLYILVSGRVLVLHEDGDGNEFVLAAVGANDFFGELGLLDSGYCTASVRALEACEVLFIPKTVAMECLESNARAAMCMLRKLAVRLCDAHRKMAGLALTNVYGRVATVLLENGEEAGGEWRVAIGSEQIATMVGASREMVSRVLKDMVQRGLARRHKRKLIVFDRERLPLRAARRL